MPPRYRSLLAAIGAALLSACTNPTGMAIEDPHPDIGTEMANIAARYQTDFNTGGMAGVVADTEICYHEATVPLTKIWALRDCMVLDFTGFTVDLTVGRRLNHSSLPYYEPGTFRTRINHYGTMDGFTSPAQLSNYLKDTGELVQQDLRQMNAAPVILHHRGS